MNESVTIVRADAASALHRVSDDVCSTEVKTHASVRFGLLPGAVHRSWNPEQSLARKTPES